MSERWQNLDQTLDELASYARDQPSSNAYHQRLLDATIQLSSAEAGAVWLFDQSGSLQRASQHRHEFLDSACTSDEHNQWLTETLRSRDVKTAPLSQPSDSADASNGSRPYFLTLCSIHTDDTPVGVVEVMHDDAPSDSNRVEQLLVAVSELAGDYHQQFQLDHLRESVETSDSLHQFALGIQKSLDPATTAYTIANDARAILQCDRVSLLTVQRNACVLSAVSGVERANLRVDTSVCLQKLANAVRHSDRPIWYGDSEPPSDLTDLLEAYVDRSHARRLAMLPLRFAPDPDQPVEVCGVLVLEHMEGHWPANIQEKASVIARHSAAALYRAKEFGSLPLLSISKTLRQLTWLFGPEGRLRMWGAAALIAALILALLFIPAELKITARGQVQPTERVRIFAPYDADVETISVSDGKAVNPNDPLLTLRSLSLEAERDEVVTKLEAAAARLQVINIEIVIVNQEGDAKTRQAQLAAERKEVEALQSILKQRQREIEARLAKLRITSPIRGEVLSWMLQSELANRPVTRGQHLLTVGNVNGEWTLELDVNDFHMRHVRRASQPTAVEFALESVPGRTMQGVIQQIEPSANVDETQRSVVRVLVDIDKPQANLRPGATAVARIHCGRTSLGYAWFHDLIDAVRQWIW